MWCKNCNIETNASEGPVCGSPTVADFPVEVYWCDDCRIPIIQTTNQSGREICPRCGRKTKYLATDLRPVFPEKRLLMELLLHKEPHTYRQNSVRPDDTLYQQMRYT